MRQRLILLVAFFFADRLLKNYIWFSETEWSQSFFIHPILNDGVAFSLQIPGIDQKGLTAVVICILAIVVFHCIRLYQTGNRLFFWWGIISAGAVSNVLDRMTLGGVFDYIDVYYWPVFNTSDVYITLGVCMILVYEFFFRHTAKQSSK